MNELATFTGIVDKQLYALANQHSGSTMTLKEITDILGVRHNDAMKTVENMSQNPDFGMITEISYSYKMPMGGDRIMETYNLNKRQSIAVAAKLNTSLLMHIIDRWQLLEDAEAARTAQALEQEREARTKLQRDYSHLSFQILTGKSSVRADMFDWKLRFRALISAHTRKPDMYGFKHTPKDAVDALAPYADDALRLISVALNAKMALGTSMVKCGVSRDVVYKVLEEFITYVDRGAEDTDEHNR